MGEVEDCGVNPRAVGHRILVIEDALQTFLVPGPSQREKRPPGFRYCLWAHLVQIQQVQHRVSVREAHGLKPSSDLVGEVATPRRALAVSPPPTLRSWLPSCRLDHYHPRKPPPLLHRWHGAHCPLDAPVRVPQQLQRRASVRRDRGAVCGFLQQGDPDHC